MQAWLPKRKKRPTTELTQSRPEEWEHEAKYNREKKEEEEGKRKDRKKKCQRQS
jgi:hypothetical protein